MLIIALIVTNFLPIKYNGLTLGQVSLHNIPTFIMDIFVYGLSYKVRRETLAELFAPYGEVREARIIVDKETRRSKGYGFVEMDEAEAKAAIEAIEGTEYMGRTVHCTPAHEKVSEPALEAE